MKTSLYVVAMRGTGSGNIVTWLTTSDYKDSNEVVILDATEYEYEIRQSDEEIGIMLDARKANLIEELEEKLKELRA